MHIIKKIEAINDLIRKKEIEEAENKLDNLFNEIEIVEINNHGRVYDFANELEFVLFCQTIDKNVNISWTRNFISELYYLKAVIYFEKKMHKESIKEINNAFKWNPCSGKMYLELLENYIKLNDYHNFEIYFNKAKEIILEPIELSMLYRKYAYFCIETKKNELAYNLLRYSFLIFPRKENEAEIEYLSKMVGIKLRNIPDIGVIKYIRDEGLEYEANDSIITAYITVIRNLEGALKKETNKERKIYLYERLVHYYNNLYIFKTDKDIHESLMSVIKEYIDFRSETTEKKD